MMHQRDIRRIVEAAAGRKQTRLRQQFLRVLVAVFGQQYLMHFSPFGFFFTFQ